MNNIFIDVFIDNNNKKYQMMEVEEDYEYYRNVKKIRVKVVTNRGIQFITTVRQDATVSDLANRALSVYL